MIQDIEYKPVLQKAASRGGELAELFVEERVQTEVVLEAGILERASFGILRGAGVRLLADLRTRYAFTNSLLKSDLEMLAAKVSESVDAPGKVIEIPLEREPLAVPLVNPVIEPPDRVAVEKKVELVRRAEAAARNYHRSIVQVRVRYFDLLRTIGIANSEGLTASDQTTHTLFMVQVVAARGNELQVGYEPMGGTMGFELFEEEDVEELAREAASKAVMMLSAAKAPGGRMPVVISSSAGGTMIHEAVGHGLEADLAEQGLSVYQDKIGKQVAGKLISVADDKTLGGKRGSYGIDDEGALAQKTVLVENGMLRQFMYDKLEAMRAGKNSTANGRRESFRFRPIVRMSNTMILPGESDPAAIIRSVDKGLFVKKMGGGQVDTVSGDFVFEVSEGYLIDGGQVAEPVRGATLIGNGPKVLTEIDMVGSDLGFGIGTCGKNGQGVPVTDAQPTLRIPEIVVGGSLG